ncbi:hypothetical protein E4U42_001101 [Claviceps africana]|uniref:Extracellular membrane protein CFEM domain-containing protein n=1 Tax=Claviceps africana TaxID=83212 RepID=A0A8K0NJE7_9HYPO|nr:hypothetical protein E4U42_001101 [Claviceps africana]
MRIAFLGSILFSITARGQSDTAGTRAVCVGDCIATLAERGLLTNGMHSVCATPQLQKAHFQCLVNSCSEESYGSAVKYSISVCSATGANIIPLHPIEVRQSQGHKRSRPVEQVKHHSWATRSQNLHLPRNVAMDLTCNTGGDGLVTVSLGPSPASATPSMIEEEGARKQSPRATSISSHEGMAHFVDGAILMGEVQDAILSSPTTTSYSLIGNEHDVFFVEHHWKFNDMANVFMPRIKLDDIHEHHVQLSLQLQLSRYLRSGLLIVLEILIPNVNPNLHHIQLVQLVQFFISIMHRQMDQLQFISYYYNYQYDQYCDYGTMLVIEYREYFVKPIVHRVLLQQLHGQCIVDSMELLHCCHQNDVDK